MSITKQFAPLFSSGMQTTQPVDPSVTSTTMSTGWGFLDELGGAFVGAIPNILDNVTKKNQDPLPTNVQPDQTVVHGDAALTKNDERNFLEKNWQMLGAGALAIAALVYVIKK